MYKLKCVGNRYGVKLCAFITWIHADGNVVSLDQLTRLGRPSESLFGCNRQANSRPSRLVDRTN